MTGSGAKSFGTPEESIFSIFYAAELLNRKPFKGRDTLSQIAPIYCTKNPGHWKASVPFFIWSTKLWAWPQLKPKANKIPFSWARCDAEAEELATYFAEKSTLSWFESIARQLPDTEELKKVKPKPNFRILSIF
jgi:hypothetical protein